MNPYQSPRCCDEPKSQASIYEKFGVVWMFTFSLPLMWNFARLIHYGNSEFLPYMSAGCFFAVGCAVVSSCVFQRKIKESPFNDIGEKR